MNKDKEIIHTVATMHEEASGPSYSVLNLCKNILDKNVKILTIGKPFEKSSDKIIKSFDYSIGPKRLGFSKSMYHYLKRLAVQKKINILHTHGMWMMPNIYTYRISKKFNIPLVYSPRGSLSEWAMSNGSMAKFLFYPLYQHNALKQASLFNASAISEYDDIRNNGFAQPVSIIPNGVHVPRKKVEPYNKSKTILFLSRIHPKKGIESLLKAWFKIQKKFPDWDIKIVGKGKKHYIKSLNEIIRDLKLERVNILDPVYGKDKEKMYRQSSLFILPTHSENFGMVVAEALANSLPVIVSNKAPWEKINHINCGWCVEDKVESYAKSLDIALNTPSEILLQMGKRGMDWMKEDFSWPSIALKTLQTYKWMENFSVDEKPDWIKIT